MPIKRQRAWSYAWAVTLAWAQKLRGILSILAGSAIAGTWTGVLVANHGRDGDPAKHVESTRWPVGVAVLLIVLATLTGAFVVFLLVQFWNLACAPVKQRNHAWNALDALSVGPMEPAHANWLQAIAVTIEQSLRGEAQANYGDSHQRTLFRQHFPQLVPLLDEWDSFPSQLETASNSALEMVRGAAREPHIFDSWNGSHVIVNYGWDFVQQNVRNTSPPEPAIALMENYSQTTIVQGGAGGGTVLLDLPAPAMDVDLDAAKGLVRSAKRWVSALHPTEPVAQWRAILAKKDDVRADLQTRLLALRHATTISKSRCGPECEPL